MKKFLIYILSLSFVFIISCKSPITGIYESIFEKTPKSIIIDGKEVLLDSYLELNLEKRKREIKLTTKDGNKFILPSNYSIGKVFLFYQDLTRGSGGGTNKTKTNFSSLLIMEYKSNDKNIEEDINYDFVINYRVIEIIYPDKKSFYLKSHDVKIYPEDVIPANYNNGLLS